MAISLRQVFTSGGQVFQAGCIKSKIALCNTSILVIKYLVNNELRKDVNNLKKCVMKKILLFSAFIGAAFFANAQSTTYKAFKVDLDVGYAIPSNGTGTKAGATFTIEPHYRLSDGVALGFRFEGAALGYDAKVNETNKIKISLLTSFCPTAEYYFKKGGFRPFAGAGAGVFTQRAVVDNTETATTSDISASATRFGFFPRAGFEAGHFRFSAAYDVVGSNASYTSFTLGFFLGGGKK